MRVPATLELTGTLTILGDDAPPPAEGAAVRGGAGMGDLYVDGVLIGQALPPLTVSPPEAFYTDSDEPAGYVPGTGSVTINAILDLPTEPPA